MRRVLEYLKYGVVCIIIFALVSPAVASELVWTFINPSFIGGNYLNASWLMAQAEAENFRKRMRRDMEDQLRFASVPMIGDILEVRDNLLRALQAAENAADLVGLKEGVAMVAKQLDDTLAKYSVEEIPALGETFDPNCHEAISQMPSDDHPSGTISHVAQSGFRMHDRVIRPSQVVVSSGSAGS